MGQCSAPPARPLRSVQPEEQTVAQGNLLAAAQGACTQCESERPENGAKRARAQVGGPPKKAGVRIWASLYDRKGALKKRKRPI